jgi:hypothetical protein
MRTNQNHFYVADKNGVTATTLEKAESLARRFTVSLDNLQQFAKTQKLGVAMVWFDEYSRRVPAFSVSSDSKIDGLIAVIDPRPLIDSRCIIASVLNRPSDSDRSVGLRMPGPDSSGYNGWLRATALLERLEGYKNIEERIVDEAGKQKVAVPTPAESAVVSTASGPNQFARAYNVDGTWVYQAPVSAKTGENFVPPQSQRISQGELEKLTGGRPLDGFPSEHRQVWYKIAKLDQI